jgi:hypothetical protein
MVPPSVSDFVPDLVMPAIVGTVDDPAVVDADDEAVVDDDFAVVVVDESLFLLLEQAEKSRPTQTAPAAMVTRFFMMSPFVLVKCSGEQIRDECERTQNEHRCSWKRFCARVTKFGVGADRKNEIGDQAKCRQNADESKDQSNEET